MAISNTLNNWTGDTILLPPNGSAKNGTNTLKLAANEVIPNGVGYGNLIMMGLTGGLATPTNGVILDMEGFSETINGLWSTNADAALGTTATNSFIQNSAASTVSTLTVGDNNATSTFAGVIRDNNGVGGQVALTKIGNGVLTLNQANTYSGNTTVNAGTLALTGVGSLANTPGIALAGGATLDVSGLASFTLGSSQILSNSTSTATVSGNASTGSGILSLTYAAGTPSLSITNGTLTLSAGTGLNINNTGSALTAGSYKLVSKATTGNAGLVVGAVPATFAVGGAGATSSAMLQIINGELYLVVGTTTTALISSENPSGFNDSLGFTATVQSNTVSAGNATGNVIFQINGVALSTNTVTSGSASSASISTLPRGTNVITAIYSGDANYLPSTIVLNQVVTNHPPVAGGATYTRNPGISLRIAVSDLLTHVTDADNDSISLVSLGASTNGVTLTTSTNYLLYQNTNAVNDQFSYTVTDGYGGANTGLVNVVISTNSVFGQTSPAISTTDGAPTISFAGIPGYSYSVDRSTDLSNWSVIWTTNAPATGVFQFTDTSAPTPTAFYRLQWNP